VQTIEADNYMQARLKAKELEGKKIINELEEAGKEKTLLSFQILGR